MGNPLWVPGGKSPNPEGGRRRSIRTPKSMIQAFIKRHISPRELKKLYDKLTEKEKMNALLELLPYVIAKQQPDSLSSAEIDELYEKLQKTVADATAKKAS